jgi:DNA-binding MarR family transcriptional regulator
MKTPVLSDQLCFKIYALSRQITALYKPLLQKLALTYPQYLVMLVLWEQGCVTVKSLGQQLLLDSGTLTPLLKRMAEMGLVQRRRSATDERVVNISLTAKGKDLQQLAVTVPAQLRSCIGVCDEDLMQFMQLSQKVLAATLTAEKLSENQLPQINKK